MTEMRWHRQMLALGAIVLATACGGGVTSTAAKGPESVV
jgi:hypothetical protein